VARNATVARLLQFNCLGVRVQVPVQCHLLLTCCQCLPVCACNVAVCAPSEARYESGWHSTSVWLGQLYCLGWKVQARVQGHSMLTCCQCRLCLFALSQFVQ
jgi:hypothetical protein